MSAFLPYGALTGETRFRTNWRGKLILQVQFMDSSWAGAVMRFRNWRDARAEDLLPCARKPTIENVTRNQLLSSLVVPLKGGSGPK